MDVTGDYDTTNLGVPVTPPSNWATLLTDDTVYNIVFTQGRPDSGLLEDEVITLIENQVNSWARVNPDFLPIPKRLFHNIPAQWNFRLQNIYQAPAEDGADILDSLGGDIIGGSIIYDDPGNSVNRFLEIRLDTDHDADQATFRALPVGTLVIIETAAGLRVGVGNIIEAYDDTVRKH